MYMHIHVKEVAEFLQIFCFLFDCFTSSVQIFGFHKYPFDLNLTICCWRKKLVEMHVAQSRLKKY